MSAPSTEFSTESLKACTYCGARQLQSHVQPRTIADRIFSLYPYRCGRCRNHQRKFHFSWLMLAGWFAWMLAIAAGIFFWQNPLTFRRSEESQSTVDALARARTSAGALSTFEQLMINKPRVTMDNATVLKLWRAQVGTEVILQMIRTSNSDYDVSANAIIELKQAGVDQSIILAMIDASYRSR
ncbi:MAG TPA: hypothetical protein VEF06_03775 [Bryobacteraceae bacterium]|nr:hypothetical protein [Bryobacteraceae bacterium]